MIDTHCHLADKRFDKDRVHVLDRARVAGVTHLVEIAYAPEILVRAHALAASCPWLFLAVGVHPSESGRVPRAWRDELLAAARHPRVVAIGETGLDFHRDGATREEQEWWFRAQLEIADVVGLPVVIHQRAALDDTLAILEAHTPKAGGVLHCFDDGPEAVARARGIGFKLGIGGCVTYGHEPLERAVTTAPDDMLVLETDAPYLEPEPRTLRRNEPGLLTRLVPRLCELKGWTPGDLDRITTVNARSLFRLPSGAPPAALPGD